MREYIPQKFEGISKEFLIRANIGRRIKPPFFKIGEYYIDSRKLGLNRQFDIVTQDKNGYIAYECKYVDSPIGKAVIEEEARQAEGLPDIGFYRLGFISKNGFADIPNSGDYLFFSLSDFYR